VVYSSAGIFIQEFSFRRK